MLRELRVSEMRYRAVLEVLDGAVISTVARRYGVSRQTVHAWLRRYAREGAVLNRTGIVVTRMVDASGQVSFVGTMYRAGRAWRGKEVEVCIVAGSVQMAYQDIVVRTQPIRHDRTKEHGAYATPHGRPRKPQQNAPDRPPQPAHV